MKTAFIFPGQGSQSVGMGKDLYDSSDSVREVYDRANEVLGYDLKEICFSGPKEKLTETKYSQPAILVTSIAYLKTVEGKPDAVAGLSLGEYTALICAGALDFSDGLRLLQNRANFMQEASEQCKGGMASVIGLSEEDVRNVIKNQNVTVDVANLNCPGQVVISGLLDEINALIPVLQSAGAKRAIPLAVSGPFHSRFMEPARSRLEPLINEVNIKEPKVPFFANVTGTRISKPDEIKECLIKQVTSSVYWEKSIINMMEIGIEDFKEVGPGNVLTGLMRRIKGKQIKA